MSDGPTRQPGESELLSLRGRGGRGDGVGGRRREKETKKEWKRVRETDR